MPSKLFFRDVLVVWIVAIFTSLLILWLTNLDARLGYAIPICLVLSGTGVAVGQELRRRQKNGTVAKGQLQRGTTID